jgi:hypothetical protein
MRKEIEAMAEPIESAEPAAVASEFEDDDEDDPAEEQEPSLLHVLNEDQLFLQKFFPFLFTMGSSCGTLSHGRAIVLAG